MNWEDKIYTSLLERKESSFKYKVCTDSIAKTAGTPERGKWGTAAKGRYDRCLEKVTEDANEQRSPNSVRQDISRLLAFQSLDKKDQTRLRGLQRELRDVSGGRNEMQQAQEDKERRIGLKNRRVQQAPQRGRRGRRTTD